MAKPAKPASSKPSKPGADRVSVSVRKIKNGYLTTQLGTRDGKFFKNEQYSRREPVVEAKPAARTASAPRQRTERPTNVGRTEYL
jgi:hypothetical protein